MLILRMFSRFKFGYVCFLQVRSAKGSGASKDEIQSLVNDLLKLKADYKTLTGNDPPGAPQQSCKLGEHISFLVLSCWGNFMSAF